MKLVLVVVTALCLAIAYGDEHVELIKELKAACIKETGITEEGVNKSRDDGDFSDPKIEDFFHCFMNAGGFLDASGKYVSDKIIDKVVALFGEDVGKTIQKECLKDSHGLGKEAAFNFAKCFQKHGPAHDL